MPQTTVKKLDGAPGVLGNYLRAFGAALPLAGHLPLLPGGGGPVPALELTVPALATDTGHLAAYAKVCGFTLRDTLPVTYLNVRAFPVHIALMTDGRFPFGPVGLVHLENEITQHRPVSVRETPSLRVWASGLDPHPKGRTLTLHTEARAGDELVWQARSTMLRTGPGGPQPDPPVRPHRQALRVPPRDRPRTVDEGTGPRRPGGRSAGRVHG